MTVALIFVFHNKKSMNDKRSAVSHPSLFQTPAIDAALDARPLLVSATNPELLWRAPDTAGGPPLTLKERRQLIRRIVPAMRLRTGSALASLLFHAFMSRRNAENLHTILQRLVYDYSGNAIGRQSDQELTGLMLSVFQTYAINVDEDATPRSKLIKHVRREIVRLNTIVAQTAVPYIVNAVEQHLSFLSAVQRPTSDAALSLPQNANNKGDKIL